MSLPAFFFERVTADIRQQMDGVLALTEQLSRQRLTADAQACVSGVEEAAGSVRRMLDAALDLRTVAVKGLTIDPQPLKLRELIDEVAARWQPQAAMGGVTLLASYDGDPDLCVVGDRQRLLQVFDGFVGEAVASMRRGAVEASIRTMIDGETVRVEGRVRGGRNAGWESPDLEARVREVDSRFGLEVAIGVMLARQVIEGLGGSFTTEGGAGGAETIAFKIDLPLAAEAPVEETQGASERSIHVLVVDDNATNRMVAQALCEMFDCTCESACDGEEAVEAAKAGRFDMILMDIKMPVMDGVAATRAIRALGGPAGAVPIIALTANAEPEDAEGYLAAGMNGVVEKPMKPEHLLAALQQALSDAARDAGGGEASAAAAA